MTSPDELADLAREGARHEIWRRGYGYELACAGDEEQAGWIRDFLGSEAFASWVWNIGRQRGKSFGFVGIADHIARTEPGAIIRYAAKTKESAYGIIEPNIKRFYDAGGCPEELRPVEVGNTWVWPGTDSVLYWAGTDNETFSRLRGPRAHLIGLDESGFYTDLDSVEKALLPQLQTTGGRALLLSTPPESPGHPFVQRWKGALASGRARHGTIWDNPRLGKQGVERFLRKEAERLNLTYEEFLESTYYLREFLAQIVTEKSRAAVPAWNEKLAEKVVGDWQRPQYYDAYVSGDFGGLTGDPHAWLFGYFVFAEQTLYIEDELELRCDTAQMAAAVKEKETALWGVNRFDGTLYGAGDYQRELNNLPEWLLPIVVQSPNAPRQPYLRVGDNDELVLGDLYRLYKLAVIPTRKDNKALAADEVSVWFRGLRIRIHRRCKRLIEQLYTTLWNKQRTEWERTDKDHGDLIDALIYMLRNVRLHRDPRPVVPDLIWPGKPRQDAQDAAAIAAAFGLKPGR
jgi:hypothetical protein